MNVIIPFLGKAWLAVGIHLWQTTLVLLPVILLARWIRSAPARLLHALWSIALLKVLLPISLFGDLAKRLAISPRTETWTAHADAGAATLDVVYAVLRPARLAEALSGGLATGSAFLPVALTILWGIGVGYAVAKLIRRKRTTPAESLALLDSLREGTREKIDQALRGSSIPPASIRLSGLHTLPHVEGWLRPRIMIPVSLIDQLQPEELQAILLHEDLHRRRRDPLRGAMLRILGAALFFYPLVRILLRRLDDATELLCDERVVRSRVGGETYARALAKTLRLGLFPSPRPFVAGVGGGSLLRIRFERISAPWRFSIMTRHRIVFGLVFLLVLAGALLPGPVAGDSDEKATSAAPAGKCAKDELLSCDKVPELLEQVPPVYPEQERKDGVTGEVLLRMCVSAEGKVDSLIVAKGVEGHPAFEQSAMAAARQWLFKPAELGRKPVVCWIQVPIAFKLN